MNKQQQQRQLCVSCHSQGGHITKHLIANVEVLVQRCLGTLKATQSSGKCDKRYNITSDYRSNRALMKIYIQKENDFITIPVNESKCKTMHSSLSH